MTPLWDLVGDLVDIFGMLDPLSYDLFQEYQPTELHHQGVERLISCYQRGLERIKTVYRQEVLEIECRNTHGRRAVEVVRTRLKDFSQQKKNRQTKVKLTQEEEKILEALLVYEDELPDSAINEVLGKLSSDWNKTKVKAAWRYRKSKIQTL
ncbi:unnamed protein product [Rhizophagus irregularis]|nr:unnamed protein product [Rhizophagus irregularis]